MCAYSAKNVDKSVRIWKKHEFLHFLLGKIRKKPYLCSQNVHMMKRIHPLLWLYILVSLCPTPLFGELRSVLPVQSISALAQDSLGYIWYGGSDGLVRFDGYSTERFLTSDQVPYYGFINAIYPAQQANEFILCTSDGLYLYNYITNDFRNLANVLTSVNITSLLFTSGRQYVITTHEGLYVFDENFSPIERVFPHSRHVNCVVEDREHNLFIGTDAGLEILTHTPSGYQCQLLSRGRTRFLYIDTYDRLWFNRLGSVCNASRHLLLTNRQTEAIRTLVQDIDIVTAYVCDNQLWVATRGQGIVRIAITEESAVLSPIIITGTNAEIANTTQTFLQDKDDNIWVGTINGLYVYTHSSHHGFNQVRSSEAEASLSTNIISAIHITPSGQVWIGSAQGINRLYKKETKTLFQTYFDNSNRQYFVDNNRIQMIEEAGNGQFLISTKYHLRFFDPVNGTFSRMAAIDSVCSLYGMRFVRSYCKDTEGNIWMAFNEGGVGVWMASKQVFEHLDWPNYKPDIHRTIFRAKDGSIWVSSDTEGLWRLTVSDDLCHVVSGKLHPRSILNNQYITAFTITHDGDIWCGTFNGLFRNFEPVCLLSVEDQVYVSALQEDADENLWVVGTHGLYKVRSDGREVRYYEIAADHDLTKLWYIIGTGRAPDSTLYFGGVDGLLYFKPNRIQEEHTMTPPVITRVSINNTYRPFLSASDKSSRDINYLQSPFVLSARDNQISFEFAALQYTDRSNLSYAYQLSGIDKDWVPTDDSRRYASYSNLRPGKYTFSVRSTNNYGEQTDNIRSVEFIIARPWYKTWWAVLMYILLAAGIVFWMVRFRMLTFELNRLHYSLKSPIKVLFHRVKPENQPSEHPYIEPLPTEQTRKDVVLINCNIKLVDALSTHLVDLFKVKHYEYGDECKEFLRKQQPAVIIIEQQRTNDATMICREILSWHKKDNAALIPVIIILSDDDDPQNEQAAYLAGAAAWMSQSVSVAIIKARIVQLLQHKQQLSEQIRQSLIVNPQQVNVLADADIFMTNVMQFIEENMNNDSLSVEQLASKLCVSSSGLYRKIKEQTGMSPNEYVRSVRLNRAAKLLESQKYKVYEICYMVGFTDQRYFATCFRHQFGLTPKAYQTKKNEKPT